MESRWGFAAAANTRVMSCTEFTEVYNALDSQIDYVWNVRHRVAWTIGKRLCHLFPELRVIPLTTRIGGILFRGSEWSGPSPG